ncbi:substrate-binding domain-containing protein [Streptomyces sp. NPDC047000]|uniref:sugar ABC transporter substrate-binding protein n=1 Tax=Streptomyces sp. NPDC047000 TaxID=3155474 RepID=UPI0033E1A0E5
MSLTHRTGSWAVRSAATGAVLTLALAGCSSTANTGTAAGAGAKKADTSALSAGFKGAFDAPPSSGPAAQKGKTVWYISCGQAYVACANAATSFKNAGTALGWKVTVVDGKADPSTAANAIKQGVAAHVDGIGLFTFDCPGIKSALVNAKSAKVPVVNFGSLDCDDSAFGGEPLFAASVNIMGSADQADLWKRLGRSRADYVAASLGSAGGTVIDVNETSQRAHQYMEEGFAAEIKAKCPKCTVVNSPFTFSQVPNPATATWKSVLLKYPKVKAITWDTDALMQLGLSTAVKQSGHAANLLKVGSEGLPSNLDLIRSGEQTSASFVPYDWYMWATADTLNRLFAGESAKSLPSQGGGVLYVDAKHNLPAAGKPVKLPVDYQAAYRAVWGK